jgi:lipopolysaccharide heptosyltransferase III
MPPIGLGRCRRGPWVDESWVGTGRSERRSAGRGLCPSSPAKAIAGVRHSRYRIGVVGASPISERPSILRRMRRLARRVAAWLGGQIVRAPRTGVIPEASAIRKVLVIRIDDRVGNVLLTTPLLVALRRALPGAEVHALIAPKKRALIEGLAEAIPFSRRSFFSRPTEFVRTLAALRSARYDVAIDASHWHEMSVSSAMLLAWTHAPIRIAHARGAVHRYATHLVAAPRDRGAEPEVATKLRLLEPLGIASSGASPPGMITNLGSRGAAAIDAWIAREALGGERLVGIAPGARKPDHRLPVRVFAELARSSAGAGCVPIVVWGPGEEAIAAAVAGEAGARVAPPTDLGELAALLRRLAAVVTNDTGPMHLAVACGVPTIALFARSDPGRWGHRSPPNAVIPADGRPEEDILSEARAALSAILAKPAPAG